MTKQEWETEARNYQRKIDAELEKPDEEQSITSIDYWAACRDNAYRSAIYAPDEQDIEDCPERFADYSKRYF